MIISYENKTPLNLFMKIGVKWAGTYILKGQQKEFRLIFVIKLHQWNVHILVQDSLCLPFPVPGKTLSFIWAGAWSPQAKPSEVTLTPCSSAQLFYITGCL